mgnify:CR=1 FL=1
MINKLLDEIKQERVKREKARINLYDFFQYTFDEFEHTTFHNNYYNILNEFSKGRLKRLIISMPPQHGKSLGSSRILPSFMLGTNPKLKIALVTYNIPFARKFNRTVQRIIDSTKYHTLFPNVSLNRSNVVNSSKGNWIRNADEFEVVNFGGGLKVTGTGGALTGEKVDILIMDDLYKDYQEANSPIYRQRVIDWYNTVAKTRLHNNSQEIIVFTRWHENDLVGFLESKLKVIDYHDNLDLDNLDPEIFVKINFEAIKESEPTTIDNREIGQALWPERHNLRKLESIRELDTYKFNALYQGKPKNIEGLLYNKFNTYDILPSIQYINAYIDTADKGNDYLCSVVYAIGYDDKAYVLDVLYTQKSQDITEGLVVKQLNSYDINNCYIESNNGGLGFSRQIKKQTTCNIIDFHQSNNKESRILSYSTEVNKMIMFKKGWEIEHQEFHNHLVNYQRIFKFNAHDDAPDTLTGIIEKEFGNSGLWDII